MAVGITFQYDVENAKPFEVQEVTSEYFISLVLTAMLKF
jgi:hypothetical protein